MQNRKTIPLKELKVGTSLLIFTLAGLALFLATRLLIPYLHDISNLETVILWFMVAGLGIFTPLLILAFFILKKEGVPCQWQVLKDRLRFHKMNKADWFWAFAGIIIIIFLSAIIMKSLEYFVSNMKHQPTFMAMAPLNSDRYWILAIWLPYWLLNILAEEILWRGVMLPRQEIAFKKNAWIVHGFGWGLFHLAFGWKLLITLLPILFIQSYIVQKRQNTWIGVVIHASINGPSFLAIAFGLLK